MSGLRRDRVSEQVSRRVVLRWMGAGAVAFFVGGCSDSDDGGDEVSADSLTPVNVPRPSGRMITRWRQDPFSLGSYSYLAVGSSPEDRSVIAEPVDDKIFFAGEAVHRDFPATVHGAHLSGLDAADALARTEAQRVAIVGAGMAGLTAASALGAEGVEVVVFEARDRLGGRIHTDDSLGVPLDLGASWIHGVEGNPLSALADCLLYTSPSPRDPE